jgi:uncharacterized protein (DUF433 family)
MPAIEEFKDEAMPDGASHPQLRDAAAELLARVVQTPDTLGGKPRIRGTRIRVVDVLDAFASGASREEIFEDYPALDENDLRAALLFARKAVSDEDVPYYAA